jgi:hypothetical protein
MIVYMGFRAYPFHEFATDTVFAPVIEKPGASRTR